MVNDDKTKDSLSAREKGDIYWRKLKYNLRAVRQKEKDVDESRSGRALALELLERYNSEKEKLSEYTERICGNEFSRRPPTATGELSYKENILHVMLSLELFKVIVSDTAMKAAGDTEGSLSDNLEKTIPVIEKTLDIWFLSNGIVRQSGEKATADMIKAAQDKLDKAIMVYEETISNTCREVSKMIVQRLKGELPKPEFGQSIGIDEFEALIEENKERYIPQKTVIDKACAELLAIRKKLADLTGDIPGLIRYIDEKGEYSYVNRYMIYKDVYAEYMDYVGEQLAAAVWAEDGCVSLIRGLLTDQKADPMVANYIKEHWGVDVPTYDIQEKVCGIPEYTALSEFESDCAVLELNGLEDALEEATKITEYRETHLRQFQFQSVSSMLFDNSELPLIGAKARVIRNKIAAEVKEGKYDTFNYEQVRRIKDAFVDVEATARVAYMVIEYNMSAKGRTIASLMNSFETDTEEMDYTIQERRCRKYIDKYFVTEMKEGQYVLR